MFKLQYIQSRHVYIAYALLICGMLLLITVSKWQVKPVPDHKTAVKIADKYLLDNGYLNKSPVCINRSDYDIKVYGAALGLERVLKGRFNRVRLPAIGYRVQESPAGWYVGYNFNDNGKDYGARATVFVLKKDGTVFYLDHGYDNKAFDHRLDK